LLRRGVTDRVLDFRMRVFSARVQNGALVPDDGVGLPEGSKVTVVADDSEETFVASAEEEAALLETIREADQGRVVPADEILRRLAG
jgi:hypothetical protein